MSRRGCVFRGGVWRDIGRRAAFRLEFAHSSGQPLRRLFNECAYCCPQFVDFFAAPDKGGPRVSVRTRGRLGPAKFERGFGANTERRAGRQCPNPPLQPPAKCLNGKSGMRLRQLGALWLVRYPARDSNPHGLSASHFAGGRVYRFASRAGQHAAVPPYAHRDARTTSRMEVGERNRESDHHYLPKHIVWPPPM